MNLTNSRSYRLTTCRARCITHQGQLISTTGQHNHAPHVKNSVSATAVAPTPTPSEKSDEISNAQTFAQPMSNQIQNMSSTVAGVSMVNQQQQQQQQQQMNFVMSNSSNNFSVSNILGSILPELDANTLLNTTQSTANVSALQNQLNSYIQITPIINRSIDDLQMQSLDSDIVDGDNMHNIAITSANN
jgi:hypothetical protein